MKKNNKGITLIALVITIIVMLILVGVSIQILIKSGLIGTAQDTVNKTTEAYREESNLEGIQIGGTEYETLDNYMASIGILDEVKSGNEAKVVSKYVSGPKTAIVPTKFTVSGAPDENTIDGGLVIYLIDQDVKIDWTGEKTEEQATAAGEKTLDYARKNFDQFVWIPVDDVNDMFMCQSEGTDTDGSGTVEEDEYNSCRIDASSGVAKCTTHNSTAMAGRLYATEVGERFNKTFKKQTYTAGSGLREPDVVSAKDGNYLSSITGVLGTTGYENIDNFKDTLQADYNAIVKSVYNTKGFWVGRYETSNLTGTDGEAVNIVAGTQNRLGSINWYYMYAQQKDYATNKELPGIISSMIQGAAYDQVMKFVDGAKYGNNDSYNVTANQSNRHTEGLSNTGSNINDKIKNIYDLEGNVRSWTTEAVETLRRVHRGGSFDDSCSASNRDYVHYPPEDNHSHFGTLSVLYVWL